MLNVQVVRSASGGKREESTTRDARKARCRFRALFLRKHSALCCIAGQVFWLFLISGRLPALANSGIWPDDERRSVRGITATGIAPVSHRTSLLIVVSDDKRTLRWIKSRGAKKQPRPKAYHNLWISSRKPRRCNHLYSERICYPLNGSLPVPSGPLGSLSWPELTSLRESRRIPAAWLASPGWPAFLRTAL